MENSVKMINLIFEPFSKWLVVFTILFFLSLLYFLIERLLKSKNLFCGKCFYRPKTYRWDPLQTLLAISEPHGN